MLTAWHTQQARQKNGSQAKLAPEMLLLLPGVWQGACATQAQDSVASSILAQCLAPLQDSKHLLRACDAWTDGRDDAGGRVNQITLFERGQVDIEADLKVRHLADL